MPMPPFRLQMMSPPQTPLEAALRACARSLGLVLAYSCSYNLLLLAPSIYLLQIYDRVLSSRSADTLVMLTLIVAFTVVIGGGASCCTLNSGTMATGGGGLARSGGGGGGALGGTFS